MKKGNKAYILIPILSISLTMSFMAYGAGDEKEPPNKPNNKNWKDAFALALEPAFIEEPSSNNAIQEVPAPENILQSDANNAPNPTNSSLQAANMVEYRNELSMTVHYIQPFVDILEQIVRQYDGRNFDINCFIRRNKYTHNCLMQLAIQHSNLALLTFILKENPSLH